MSVATDGVVYETDVLAASNVSPYMYRHKHSKSPSHSRAGTSSPSSRRKSAVPQHMRNATSLDAQNAGGIWGQRPVLVLVGVRLGIQGVNPIYYDALKVSFRCHTSEFLHFALLCTLVPRGIFVALTCFWGDNLWGVSFISNDTEMSRLKLMMTSNTCNYIGDLQVPSVGGYRRW